MASRLSIDLISYLNTKSYIHNIETNSFQSWQGASLQNGMIYENKHFPEVDFDFRPERPGDVKETKANIAPFKKIGWTANINIFDGIEDCFARIKK